VQSASDGGVAEMLDGDPELTQRRLERGVFASDHEDPIGRELAQRVLDREHRVTLARHSLHIRDRRDRSLGPDGSRVRVGACLVLVGRVPVDRPGVRRGDEPDARLRRASQGAADRREVGVLVEDEHEQVLAVARVAHARSATPSTPAVSAQWAQQKTEPSPSTPCPTTRQPQWPHTGASAWIAHSKLSKTYMPPRYAISSGLS
jgi:hypothetical protein